MRYFWFCIVGAALLFPPLMDILTFKYFDLTFIVRVCGLMGFTLMSLQFILSSRLPFLEKQFTRGGLMKLHRKSGAASWLLLLVHGLLYLGLKIAWEGGLSFDLSYEWPVAIGMGGLAFLTLIAVTALYRKALNLSYPVWKKIHRISYFIYIPLFFHALILGSTILSIKAVQIQWIAMFSLVLASWIWRVQLYWRNSAKT